MVMLGEVTMMITQQPRLIDEINLDSVNEASRYVSALNSLQASKLGRSYLLFLPIPLNDDDGTKKIE